MFVALKREWHGSRSNLGWDSTVRSRKRHGGVKQFQCDFQSKFFMGHLPRGSAGLCTGKGDFLSGCVFFLDLSVVGEGPHNPFVLPGRQSRQNLRRDLK